MFELGDVGREWSGVERLGVNGGFWDGDGDRWLGMGMGIGRWGVGMWKVLCRLCMEWSLE